MTSRRYVVITPVRNEENFLQFTIDSLAAQSTKPQEWIIVDDGSTDATLSIARAAAAKYPWIQVIQRCDRGARRPGGGVVEAFYEGYRGLVTSDWEFLVKLDGDLSFERDYFEKSLSHFEGNRMLGIGGGTVCMELHNELLPEAPYDPAFHVRGAAKIYKRDCWKAIGILIAAPGWDTVDEYKANMLGWVTYTFPELKLRHHRPAGAAQGVWKNWIKNGLANYVAGYHPLFMAFKCAKRAFSKPYLIGAIALSAGYLGGYLKRQPRVDDEQLIRYLRIQQLRRLFLRRSLWDVRLPNAPR